MYAVQETTARVNQVDVPVYGTEINKGNTSVIVKAGSTGIAGGERDAGGRVYLKFITNGDFYFEPIDGDEGETIGFRMACSGDSMMQAFKKVLKFTLKVMKDAEVDG